MKTMNSMRWICDNSESLALNKKEQYAVVVQEQTEVTYGFDNDCNFSYCEEHNIPYIFRNTNGGCIVHCEGNISLTLLFENIKHPTLTFDFLTSGFIRFLKENKIENVANENDVLVDGYKVASGYEINIAPDWKWKKIGLQISINQDLETIQNVCLKPMVKVPKGLSEYGITKEQVLEWIENWLSENFKEGEEA